MKLLSTYRKNGLRGVCQRILWHAGHGLMEAAAGLERKSAPELSGQEQPLLARNAAFRNCHAGKRCFVIGNGPSLKTQDLSPLADEITFVVSGFWKHPIVDRWQPSYHCFADPLFFDGSEAMRKFFGDLRARIHSPTFWVPLYAQSIIHSHSLLPSDRTHFVSFSGDLADGSLNSIDLTAHIPGVINVVELAIMAAMYMGCSPIYLLGLDHDWLSHRGRDQHFYESKTIANHPDAHGDLARYSYKHLMECQLTLWRGYESLLQCAQSRSIRILNATAGGFLDVFERARFEEIIHQTHPSE